MLAPELRDGSVGVVVFTRILERVVVRSAADATSRIVEDHEGEEFVDLLCGQRRRKAQRRDVESDLSRVAALILVVAGKRIAQLENRSRTKRVVIGQQEVAPVGHVLS